MRERVRRQWQCDDGAIRSGRGRTRLISEFKKRHGYSEDGVAPPPVEEAATAVEEGLPLSRVRRGAAAQATTMAPTGSFPEAVWALNNIVNM